MDVIREREKLPGEGMCDRIMIIVNMEQYENTGQKKVLK